MKPITRLLLLIFCAFCAFCGQSVFAAHRLENKSTAITNGADQPAITYADLLRIVASAPAQGGLQVEQMRKRLRILDACDAARGQPDIVLEDADYDFAVTLAEAHPWGAVNRDIVAFTDALKTAPKVETGSRETKP